MSDALICRRGACPSLSVPMQTGDGLLVRLNPVSQGLAPRQLIGLCNAAARHGNGVMEITARGNLQIRGFTQASAALLADDVDGLGIETRTGVSISITPLAGLDPQEIADPRPLANALRAAIESAGLSTKLGPKVSIVIDSGGQIDLTAIGSDIRLTAARRRNGAFWRIAIAGDARTAEPMGGASESGVVGFALDTLEQIASHGGDARARDILPPESAQGSVVSPDRPTPPAAIALGDGRIALAIALPFGSAVAADIAALAQIAESSGVADIRLAPGRRLLILCPDTTAALTVRDHAAALGFITSVEDPRLTISACAGAPACASGRIPTRAIAEKLVTQAPGAIAHLGDVHISGCEKGCAHPAEAALTLVGKPEGIGIVVDGKARDAASTVVTADDLPEAVNAIKPSGS